MFSALLAVASAVVIPAPAYPAYHHGPALAGPVYPAIAKAVVAKVAAPEPYDPNPQYSFSYDVHVSINIKDVKILRVKERRNN